MSLGRGFAHAGNRPALSVVIPTHEGSLTWLGNCLDSLVAQENAPAIECVLVLDGPAPEVASLARLRLPAARQIVLRRPRGFAGAANEGLRAARGDLVALVNDDVRLSPGWAHALLCAADASPDAGSFASRVLLDDGSGRLDSAGHGLTRWGEPFAIGSGLPDGPDFDSARFVFGAPASASAYRRQLLLDVGVFDEQMEAYLEDIDHSLRAQLLGFPCLYVPDAIAHHRGSASYGMGPGGSGRAERLLLRNRVHFMARSMPRSVLQKAAPAVALSLSFDLLHRALTGRHPAAALAGLADGLRGVRASSNSRPATLGGMRLPASALAGLLRESERDLQNLGDQADVGQLRRTRARLSGLLSAWLDARDDRSQRWSY